MQSFSKDSAELETGSRIYRSGIRQKNQNMNDRNELLEECKVILKKPHESRNITQNQFLLKLIQKSEFLKEVTDIQGIDFVKGILRHAKLQVVDARQVIVEQDQPLNYMLVLLQGKLSVQKPSFDISQDVEDSQYKEMIQNLSLKTQGLIQKLTMLAKKQRDQMRKASKLQRKTTFPVSQYQFIPPVLNSNDFTKAQNNIERNILSHEQYGGKERLNNSIYKSRVFAVERSVILIFEMNFLFYWLESSFKTKMNKNIQRLKTITPFETLQDEKLAEIIMSMKLVRRKKNDPVYIQGEDAEIIYLLIQGELKISKEVDLFKENPNDFYVDRRKLVRNIKKSTKQTKSKSVNHDDGVLQFANLTRLYNYRPVKKLIQIGIISSFGLFGEEEVVFQTKRQATIHVNSIDASYYEIQFRKILQIIGSKIVDKFKQALEVSISKKILYRQIGVADQIDFQNRTNMDYFYLEEGKSKQSPRKFKLQKINERVIPHTSRDNSDHAPAFYTTFNFNKMLDKRYSSATSSNKHKKTSESVDAFELSNYNPTEQRLMGISHSWNPIQKKVKQQKFVSRKISPIKHQINISEPLIDQQFFKDMAKQQRRINKEFRTIRLSLGKKIK